MEQNQNGADEATVMAMIGDWRDEALNLDDLLQNNSDQQQARNNSNNSQSQTNSGHNNQRDREFIGDIEIGQPQKLPTFSNSANRPSVLDLSVSNVVNPYSQEGQRRSNMNGHSPHSPHQQQRVASPHQQRAPSPHQQLQSPHSPHQQQQSPHSPHHSPYMANQPVFNYNNVEQQHSPVSPHPQQQMHSPVSPHQRSVSPHSHIGGDQGPMSPHMSGGQMSPHHQQGPPPLSPHSPYARSVSPHSQHNMTSPVSPHHNSGGMSPHHPGMHGGAMSPHHNMSSHSGNVSPVPRQLSPAPGASSVFGRYAGSPVSMHSGNSSDTESYYSGMGYSSAQIEEMRKRGVHIEKGSDLYKAKRERNNVAVRKSREKKKQREQETEKRVKELSDENSTLQNKLDIALKEMNLLKNLYKNIGVQLPPEARHKLENELSKFK